MDADRYEVPPQEIEVLLPPFRGRGNETLFGASNGDLWLYGPGWTEARRPDSFRQHALVVPLDESRPARNAVLPENFLLRDVSDDALLGIHVDPITYEHFVRVYRILWEEEGSR